MSEKSPSRLLSVMEEGIIIDAEGKPRVKPSVEEQKEFLKTSKIMSEKTRSRSLSDIESGQLQLTEPG